MKHFGPRRYLNTLPQNPTPVGEKCLNCEEAFVEGDEGCSTPYYGGGDAPPEVHYHIECFVRSIIGSVGHQTRKCSCYGGTEEDPPGLTAREAAKAAMAKMKEIQA